MTSPEPSLNWRLWVTRGPPPGASDRATRRAAREVDGAERTGARIWRACIFFGPVLWGGGSLWLTGAPDGWEIHPPSLDHSILIFPTHSK